jgi:uncharacterized protein (DUF58 family)
MRMRGQLDLFKAEIVVFPFDRRGWDVRHMAKFLSVVHGEYAERGWKAHCKAMARRLRAAGVAEEEIRHQMSAFQDAVQAELWALNDQIVRGGA